MQQNDFNQVLDITAAGTVYSDAYQLLPNSNTLDVSAETEAIGGTSPTVDVTVQVSEDKETWTDLQALTQLTTATKVTYENLANLMTFARFKVVTAGTDPTATLRLFAQGREQQSATITLPLGASTEAKQDDEIALLTTIDADTGAISTAASAIQTSSAATQALLDAISNVINGDANLVIDTEITTAIVNVGAGATTEVITAPGANKQIWVYGALLMADVAGTIALTQNGSPLTGVQPVGDNGGFSLPLSNNYKFPWIKLPSNEGLDVTTVTCTADGIIVYAIIDVS